MQHSMNKPLSFVPQKDSQRVGTESCAVTQLDFLAVRKPCRPVEKAYVLSLPSFRRAIRYSLSLADLEPKQVYEPLDMDKATWSRIENGQQAFPPEKLKQLRELVGNDAALIWLAHDNGYDLVPLRTELEEQLQASEARAQELERQNDLMRELLTGRR